MVSRPGGYDSGVLEDSYADHQEDGRAGPDGDEKDGPECLETACPDAASTLQKGLQEMLGDDGL